MSITDAHDNFGGAYAVRTYPSMTLLEFVTETVGMISTEYDTIISVKDIALTTHDGKKLRPSLDAISLAELMLIGIFPLPGASSVSVNISGMTGAIVSEIVEERDIAQRAAVEERYARSEDRAVMYTFQMEDIHSIKRSITVPDTSTVGEWIIGIASIYHVSPRRISGLVSSGYNIYKRDMPTTTIRQLIDDGDIDPNQRIHITYYGKM